MFAYTGMRIARRSADPFLRLLTATATMWVIGQVFINVGYVIGLLPVTGIQLPLISAGGTSTATTLFMIGLMANAARHEPAAVAALRGQRRPDERLLRLPLPAAYVPTRVEALRDRLRSRPQTPKPAKPTKPVKAGEVGPEAGSEARQEGAAGRRGAARRGAAVPAKARTAARSDRQAGHHGVASRQGRAGGAGATGIMEQPRTAGRHIGRSALRVSVSGVGGGLEPATPVTATAARCRSSSPAVAPRVTSNPPWRSPTP